MTRRNNPRRLSDLRKLTSMVAVPNTTPVRVRLKIDPLRGEVTKREAEELTWVVSDAQYELNVPDDTNSDPGGPRSLADFTLWLTIEEANDGE